MGSLLLFIRELTKVNQYDNMFVNKHEKGIVMQKGFILYYDMKQSFDEMTDKEIGMLVRALMNYGAEGIEPEKLSHNLRLTFGIMRRQMDRDAEKYRKTCIARSIAGKKSAEARYGKSYTSPGGDILDHSDFPEYLNTLRQEKGYHTVL